ncbi:hypothetical protein [Agilicoccus flavus]|uniref:hypothetical protein n=1 Tax=Agilicoccus flavus TaxID=2775968 RepID=UPI0027DA763F|nr:hypothetical protein [Agilicoccus flavus]
MPAALTRVGAAGSKIVNSSAGGGSKDTWILGPTLGPTPGPTPDKTAGPSGAA